MLAKSTGYLQTEANNKLSVFADMITRQVLNILQTETTMTYYYDLDDEFCVD